jgi:hypothetical protein
VYDIKKNKITCIVYLTLCKLGHIKKNSRNFCRKNSLQIINSNSDRFFLVSECSGEHLRGGDNYIDSIDNNMNNLSIQEKI